jgi:hypothetical protein
LAVVKGYRYGWIDTIQKQGYYDWRYRPLEEIQFADNKIHSKDLVLKTSIKYSINSFLSAQVQFQHENQIITGRNFQNVQTFAVRNLINQFSAKQSDGSFIYNFPVGGILGMQQRNLNSNNLRGQISYNQIIKSKHAINFIAGAEIKETKSDGSSYNLFGYDDETGVAASSLNYNTRYTLFPSLSSSKLPTSTGNITGSIYRFISYFGNAAYTYNSKYTISISGRRDGANLFGVKTNDKIKPFWSTGLKWNISEEKFYDFAWLPNLKLRATYGFTGNVYNGGAYLTGRYFGVSDLTTASVVVVSTPPNPELRWEKVKVLNLGLDFGMKDNIVSGSIEWYQKDGLDLIEPAPLAPSTGFTSFTGNAASTRTKGVEIVINTRNIDKGFKWYTTFLTNTQINKVTHYDPKYQGLSLVNSTSGIALEGKSLYSIFSYKWAGLDPSTGDPQGYLNKTVSKDYSSIINNATPDSLVYNGSARPTLFGALRNTFVYKNFSLSINLTYNFGYYFRKPGVSLNYQDILSLPNSDYTKRWQNPGDESLSNVPSLSYPSNTARNSFYQYSEVLVEKADHIRLKDVQLSYEVSKKLWKKMPFTNFQVYGYATNLGLIWKANKSGLDPDYYNSLMLPGKTFSIGAKIGL